MWFKLYIAFAIAMLANTASQAHQHIRPGLWEVTTKSDVLALVPHIPSEHWQQLERLAQRYGLKLPQIENNAATSQICITPEMAQQEIPAYFYESRTGCTVQNATRTGNNYQLDLVCANAHFQGNGSAQGTFHTPEHFSGHTDFDSTLGNQPIFASAETVGRWVGEHCTAVNPLP